MDRIAPTEVAYILGLFLTMVYGGWRREGIHGCNHVWSAVVVFAVFVCMQNRALGLMVPDGRSVKLLYNMSVVIRLKFNNYATLWLSH
jgi:hypothetical protein